MQQGLQRSTEQAANNAARGKIPDVIGIDCGKPARGEDQRQNANNTQRYGEVIDVFVAGLMSPGKPAATDDYHGDSVSHDTKNEEQRIRQPCSGYSAQIMDRLVPCGLRPTGVRRVKAE